MKGEVLGDVVLHMTGSDTVATAIADLEAGTGIPADSEAIDLVEDVPFGHKVALESRDTGDAVVKYGEIIGRATQAIEPGEWVHTHNCESTRGRGDITADEGEVA